MQDKNNHTIKIPSIEKNSPIIIGLTGSFGSGCSTLAKALEELEFKSFSLSDIVKEEWKTINKRKDVQNAHRFELQDIGNDLRENNGEDFLAEQIYNRANPTIKENNVRGIVFDSIRNTEEIQWFRDHCRNFYLIAVDCSRQIRWERVKEKKYYNLELTERDFKKDDDRDRDEEFEYGQKVQLCVYEADVVINNDKNYPGEKAAINGLRKKVENIFIKRISKNGDLTIQVPNNNEFYMNLAYCASLMSKCIKRQVGAGIVDMNNVIVSIGYNQNPNHKSCIDEYRDCYREYYKDKHKEEQSEILKNKVCPNCKKHQRDSLICPDKKCGTDLGKLLITDKALSKCLALHAEEMALMNVGIRNLEGYTLYTTTYPCLICARKIAYSGIKKIVYVEAYTDQESEDFIKESGIEAIKFEGIKARAYFRLFGSSRRIAEDKIKESRKIKDSPIVQELAKRKIRPKFDS